MPINGITSDIAADGITIAGTPFGGTRPGLGGVGGSVQLDGISIFSRTFQLPQAVNAGGSLSLPVSFGQNKYIISANGKSYCPGIDFVPGVTEARWLNSNEGIAANTDITVWGPGNDYTAAAITIERVDMKSTQFIGTTIHLYGEGGGLSLPANKDSIFMVVNNQTVNTFTWDGTLVSWTGTPALASTDIVFFYYFNKTTTTPFSLGENQTRMEFSASLGVSTYNIGAIPKKSLVNATQLLVNNLRKVYGKEYYINYPTMYWSGSPFTGTEQLDLSYIREALSAALIVNNSSEGGAVGLNLSGKFQAPTTGVGSTSFLNLLTINGTLMVGPNYVAYTISSGAFVPEYAIFPNNIQVDPTARGLPPLSLSIDDEYVFTTFRDVNAAKYVKIEYFKGWNGAGDAKTLQFSPADPSKVIVWLYGRAYFSFLGEVNVLANAITVLDNTVPTDADADIVVMYITDPAYSALWNFSNISFAENTWAIGASIGDFSGSPIGDINNTFLFVNKQRETPGKYDKNADGTRLINKTLASTIYGTGSGDPDQIVLVKI